MQKPIKKIIIVGGGSAGWMSAAFISKQFPDLEIALIESPDVPIIGVGESTLGTINQFLSVLEITDEDFMPSVKGAYKLGIKFTDFYEKGQAFYYPFGIKDQQNCQNGIADWYLKKVSNPETPNNDFYESFYSCMPFIYESKIYDNADGQLPGFSFRNDVAYHMDAIAFGQYLKNKIALPNGVVHVVEHIEQVHLDDNGYISGLSLKNGDTLEADLYLDCTGFKSLLLGQTLQVPFDSYSYVLPNNKAWAVQIPYTDIEKELENVTNCTAIDNGWVWNIPLYNRIGSGYVYCDKFISDEDALQQFKDYLDSDQMKVYNPERSKNLEFKKIEIRNGAHQKCWYKNCVGVGLSYGFIEPLESTGLLSVQEILLRLCETLHCKQVNKIQIDSFNWVIDSIMQSFRTFVGYHYTLSSRRDTPYWRHVTEVIEMESSINSRDGTQNTMNQVADIAARMLQMHNLPGDMSMGGMPDIFVGMNYLPVNKTHLDMMLKILEGRTGEKPEILNSYTQDYWNQKKEYINSLAAEAPSHYEYLKTKIFKEE